MIAASGIHLWLLLIYILKYQVYAKLAFIYPKIA